MHSGRFAQNRGVVLIMVLWMVIILGVIGLGYAAAVRTQARVALARQGRATAGWAARAGVERAMAALTEAPLGLVLGESDLLFDDADSFKEQPVGDAVFTLYVPPLSEDEQPRFGLVDEAAKLNINAADEATLTRLPGMTAALAEALIDWRDSDDLPLAEGAELETYQSLSEPYAPRNAPLGSLRELLMVKGWAAVFDRAWPDPLQRFAGASAQAPSDGESVELTRQEARALLGSLTTWSLDSGLASDGQAKLDLATVTAEAIRQRVPALSDAEAKAIVKYRERQAYQSPADLLQVTEVKEGGSSGAGAPPPGNKGGREQRPNQAPGQNGNGGGQSQEAGKKLFTLQRVATFIDSFTVKANPPAAAGRVNLNTASRDVLLALPGMNEALADAVISSRQAATLQNAEGLLNVPGMNETAFTQLYPQITLAGRRYGVMVRGFDPASRSAVTVEAVLSKDEDRVRVLAWRER